AADSVDNEFDFDTADVGGIGIRSPAGAKTPERSCSSATRIVQGGNHNQNVGAGCHLGIERSMRKYQPVVWNSARGHFFEEGYDLWLLTKVSIRSLPSASNVPATAHRFAGPLPNRDPRPPVGAP